MVGAGVITGTAQLIDHFLFSLAKVDGVDEMSLEANILYLTLQFLQCPIVRPLRPVEAAYSN
jgi:hypothetical protein